MKSTYPVTLYLRRFYAPNNLQFKTLEAAVKEAIETLDAEDAWPERIEDNGEIVWQQSGPFGTRDSLEQFLNQLTILPP